MAQYTFQSQESGSYTFSTQSTQGTSTLSASASATATASVRLESRPGVGSFPAIGDLSNRSWLPDTSLPDILTFWDGSTVTTQEDWDPHRKSEIWDLAQHYLYGEWHGGHPDILSTTLEVDKNIFTGDARLRVWNVTFDVGGGQSMYYMLVTPSGVTNAPLIQHMSWKGMHAHLDDTDIPLHDNYTTNGGASSDERGTDKLRFQIQDAINRGYACGVVNQAEVVEDRGDNQNDMYNARSGHNLTNRGQHDWGFILASSWAHMLGLDVAEWTGDVGGFYACSGISRRGKGALLAGVVDERVDVTITMRSGTLGAGASRDLGIGDPWETIDELTTTFPHWAAKEASGFPSSGEDIPLDQHAIIALCEARRVLVTQATNDDYSRWEREWDTLVGADDAYNFVGEEGVTQTSRPAEGVLIDTQLGFFRRSGTHDPETQDWDLSLDYLDVATNEASLSGSGSATATAQGDASLNDNLLSSSVTGNATVAGTLSRTHYFGATAPALATVSGFLGERLVLQASVPAQATASGSASVTHYEYFNVSASAVATVAATYTENKLLGASATGQATVSGATKSGTFLNAAPTARATASGALNKVKALSATASAQATLSGASTSGKIIRGSATGRANTSAQATSFVQLGGSTSGIATVSGALGSGRSFSASANAVATSSGTLTRTHFLQGSATANATISGVAFSGKAVRGSATGTASASGQSTRFVQLGGSAAGTAAIAGPLKTTTFLNASTGAQATASGALGFIRFLGSSVAGTASISGFASSGTSVRTSATCTAQASGQPTYIVHYGTSVTGTATTQGATILVIQPKVSAQATATLEGGITSSETRLVSGSGGGTASVGGSLIRVWVITGTLTGTSTPTARIVGKAQSATTKAEQLYSTSLGVESYDVTLNIE